MISLHSEQLEVMNSQGKAYSLSQAPGKADSIPCSFKSVNKSKLCANPTAEDKWKAFDK